MKNIFHILITIALITMATVFHACKEKDTPVAAQSVSLNKTELNLLLGDYETLDAIVAPDNASPKVKWESDDETVASVDNRGKVTALKGGTADITAVSTYGGKMATCRVTVIVPVESVSLKEETTIALGRTETLAPTISPADATNQNVTWKSSNVTVATVDATGKVTANKLGMTVITVTTEDGGKKAACVVTVAEEVSVTGITLSPSEITLFMNTGGKGKLTAIISPANATDKSVNWSSNPVGIVTVDPDGTLTAIAVGTTIVTATTADGGYTATCDVAVEAKGESENLLKNGGFEENESAALIINEWTTITKELGWYEAYYKIASSDIGFPADNSYAIVSGRSTFTGARAPLVDVCIGNNAVRIPQTTGGIYQLVDVTPGKKYQFSILYGYATQNANQSFKDKTLKILSEDGMTLYGETPLDADNTTADNKNITTATGVVSIPAGVTKVRYQVDILDQLPNELGLRAPIFAFDECIFQELIE